MVRQLNRVRSDRSVSRKPVDFIEKAWQSSQYQVLDTMCPLVQAWASLPSDDPSAKAVETTFQLLGGAFANISNMRRANVLRQIAPKMMSFSDDPTAFSSREAERLILWSLN